ncbi:MAG: FIST N-terminal domain-containing protein [Anaerolineae bacterium]|nr:FIST C-terminal domain-containing protein [Anaerolineae bacterium]MDW8067370.1 FIST N-terminal domain-containing protein [Anaerolineae bacterium]
MAVQAGVGWSLSKDARTAAGEAVAMAMEGLKGASPGLALLFATVDMDLPVLVGQVARWLGKTPLFGASSFTGVLTSAGFQSGPEGAVGLMLLSGVRAGVSCCALGQNPARAGALAAGLARRKAAQSGLPDLFLVTTPPGSEEAVVAGISRKNPGVPIVGGSPADNTIEGKWQVFANGRVLGPSAAVAALYAEGKIGRAFGSGYRPTALRARAGAEGRTLKTLDGRPALDVYAEWTGKRREDLIGDWKLLGECLLAPLATPVGDAYLIKHLAVGNEDGTIGAFAEFTDGEEVVLMEATLEEVISAAGEMVRQAAQGMRDLRAVFLVHCAGRRVALGERIGEVVGAVKSAAGDAPFLGFCSFGEQGMLVPGVNLHGNLMLSALVVGE